MTARNNYDVRKIEGNAQTSIHCPALFPAILERMYRLTGTLRAKADVLSPTLAAAAASLVLAVELLAALVAEESIAEAVAVPSVEPTSVAEESVDPSEDVELEAESVPVAAVVEFVSVVPVAEVADVVEELVELLALLPTATHPPKGPAAAEFLHRTRQASPLGPPVQLTPLQHRKIIST